MDKFDKAIAYFEDAIRESDEIISECSKALRWLANETEFIFAADTLRKASDELERLQAENSTLKKALELACESIAGEMPYGEANGYYEYYIKKAKEESENG